MTGRIGDLRSRLQIATLTAGDPLTGADAPLPYLFVAMPDANAARLMPTLAAAIGVNPQPNSYTPRPAFDVHATFDGGTRLLLHAAGEEIEFWTADGDVSAEWARLAIKLGRLYLYVGYAPFKHVSAADYFQNNTGGEVIAAIPVRDGKTTSGDRGASASR